MNQSGKGPAIPKAFLRARGSREGPEADDELVLRNVGRRALRQGARRERDEKGDHDDDKPLVRKHIMFLRQLKGGDEPWRSKADRAPFAEP
jgi:hypothetical protein